MRNHEPSVRDRAPKTSYLKIRVGSEISPLAFAGVHYSGRCDDQRGLYHNLTQNELVEDLNGLKEALDEDADVEMQKMYPKGFVFMNALYGLAWSKVANDEAHDEIEKAWKKIDNDRSLPDGSFYNGWSSYVLGSKLQLESKRDTTEVRQFQQQCDSIAAALQVATYPSSYPGASWPADVTVCVASLSLHDRLFEPKYESEIKKWLGEVKNQLDERGMIPHSLHESARGSSMALMLIFLKTIDEEFARDQFRLFKENFVEDKFGLVGILEYPKSDTGEGDVDSGPVIMGFGGAATIVGMQTLSKFGEDELAAKIRKEIYAVDVIPFPMADAFIAWSHSGMTRDETDVSFTRFHVYSLIVLGILVVIARAVIPLRAKKPSS